MSSVVLRQFSLQITRVTAFATVVGIGYTAMGPLAVDRINAMTPQQLYLAVPWTGWTLDLEYARDVLLGLNFAVAGVANLAAVPSVPFLVNRFGDKCLAVVCALVLAFCMPLYAYSSIWVWFLIRLLFHASLGVLFVVSEYWILEEAQPEFRGRMIALYATSLGLGFAVGPATLHLCRALGLSPYLVDTLVFLAAAVVITGKISRNSGYPVKTRGYLLKLIRAYPAALFGAFVFGLFEYGVGLLMLRFTQRSGFSENQGLTVLTIFFIGNILFQWPMGVLSDRYSRPKTLIIIAAVGVVGAFLILLNQSFYVYAVIIFFWSGPIGGLYVIGLNSVVSVHKSAEFSQVNAAFVTCYSLGMLFGPIVIGAAMGVAGTTGFSVAVAAAFLAYLGLLTIQRGIA